MTSWNKLDFRKFLVEELDISPRVARDYADRCLRIERELGIDLLMHTKNAKAYANLANKLHEHFIKQKYEKKRLYALNAIHMNAVRKLSLFIWGESVVDTYKKYFQRTY